MHESRQTSRASALRHTWRPVIQALARLRMRALYSSTCASNSRTGCANPLRREPMPRRIVSPDVWAIDLLIAHEDAPGRTHAQSVRSELLCEEPRNDFEFCGRLQCSIDALNCAVAIVEAPGRIFHDGDSNAIGYGRAAAASGQSRIERAIRRTPRPSDNAKRSGQINRFEAPLTRLSVQARTATSMRAKRRQNRSLFKSALAICWTEFFSPASGRGVATAARQTPPCSVA